MKKLILKIVFLCFTFGMMGQNYFNKTYSVSNYQSNTSDILKLDSNEYLITGDDIDSASNYGISFLKIDGLGNTLIKKNVLLKGPRNHDYTPDFVHLISPSTFICSSTITKGSKYAIVISRHSLATLDTLSTSCYYDTTYDLTVRQCKYIGNGKLICIGSKFDNAVPAYKTRTLVLKMDTMGNVVWKQELFPFQTEGTCIEYNPVTKGYIIAMYNILGPQQACSKIACLDSLGNIMGVSTISASYDVCVTSVCLTSNNEYVFAGSKSDALIGPYFAGCLLLIKTDDSVHVIWQKTYGLGNPNNALCAVKQLPDGSIISCGVYCPDNLLTSNKIHAYYMKTNSNGDSLWSNQLALSTSGYKPDCFSDVEQTSDKGFIFSGWPYYNSEMWVVKTDSSGCLWGNCGIGVKEYVLNDYFNVFPNPATYYINIEMESGFSTDLYLYNSSGINLGMEKLIDGKCKIDFSNYSSGIYFFKVSRSDGSYIVKRVSVLK